MNYEIVEREKENLILKVGDYVNFTMDDEEYIARIVRATNIRKFALIDFENGTFVGTAQDSIKRLFVHNADQRTKITKLKMVGFNKETDTMVFEKRFSLPVEKL